MGCPPVRKIIHLLKLVDYLQADNPWYNYYVTLHQIWWHLNWFDSLELCVLLHCIDLTEYSISILFNCKRWVAQNNIYKKILNIRKWDSKEDTLTLVLLNLLNFSRLYVQIDFSGYKLLYKANLIENKRNTLWFGNYNRGSLEVKTMWA